MSGQKGRGEIIRDWWQAAVANRDSGRARALAARLRRADALAAVAEPEVQDLARRLGIGPGGADRLARLVRVLAWVRADDGQTLARRLGGPEPALSNLRFQRLLRARGEDLAEALRRALPMADHRCNVAALGRDLLSWDHPDWGDAVRTRWTFDYFAAPLPEGEGKTDEETTA